MKGGKMKNLLKWLNGKKTFIGLALFFVLGGALQIGIIDQATFDQYSKWAEIVIGVGIAHKIKKAV